MTLTPTARQHRYTARDPKRLLAEQGCEHMVRLAELYDRDPYFKGSHQAFLHPPPCRRLFHVYGTNLDTEIAYLYRYRHGIELEQDIQVGTRAA
jgi:hypothetical protein